MLLRNGQKPIPCSDALLDLLLIAWERHSRSTEQTINGYLLQVEQDRQYALARENYEFHSARVMDNVTEVQRQHGIETRPLISIPGRARKEARWRQRSQFGRPRRSRRS